jgi:hypothetical protein
MRTQSDLGFFEPRKAWDVLQYSPIGKGVPMKTTGFSNARSARLVILGLLLTLTVAAQATTTDNWQRKSVDWRAGDGRRIKGIYIPKDKPFLMVPDKSSRLQTPIAKDKSIGAAAAPTEEGQIDSPPVSGFVPHIAIAVTNARSSDDFDWVAQTQTFIVGRFLTSHPDTDFAIGLLDLGAGFNLMGYGAAQRTGIVAANLLTTHTIELLGATGTASAWVSQPLAIFVDGLHAVDPNTLILNHSNMVGQSNVVLGVGQRPDVNMPDLPTAIGSPLAVNFAAAIFNDRQITRIRDANEYTGPDVKFYDLEDPCIPQYPNRATLNLIPAGALDVEYFPDFESIMELVLEPGQPSVITGTSTQSLFFFDSVDLYNGTRSSLDKHRFMLDTGAQVSVISSSVGARLHLNPATPDFQVDIEDASGETTINPGFFIDTIEIPALGDWLSFTHVPVVLLDITSPEGGYMDGIIGTNLFVEFNLVIRGGGLLGQDPPSLEFQRIALPPAGDIAPLSRDGSVDFRDLAAFANAWLSSEGTPNWNPRADLFPRQIPDGKVDNADLAIFAAFWRETAGSPDTVR